MSYKGKSLLFEGGLLLGFDETNVLSSVRGEDSFFNQDRDFTQKPGSVLRFRETGSAQYVRIQLVDTDAENPVGVSIVQESLSYDTFKEGDFVILRYTVTNDSEVQIENMFAGLWLDWDLGSGEGFRDNNGDFFDESKISFVESAAGSYPVVGVRLLSDNFAKTNHYIMDLETELFEDNENSYGRTKKGKWEILSASNRQVSRFGSDLAQIVSAGPISIAPGSSETIVFALIAGDNLEDLFANTNHAVATYSDDAWTNVSNEKMQPVPEWITIREVFPHPITHQAIFTYKLTRSAQVKVSVYDILGRHVTQLLDATKAAGDYTISWNIENLNLPGGVYSVNWNVAGPEKKYMESRFVIVQ